MRGIDGQWVFTKPDLEQTLNAIITMHRATATAGMCSIEYDAGVRAAIAAFAAAIGVSVDTYPDTPTVTVVQAPSRG